MDKKAEKNRNTENRVDNRNAENINENRGKKAQNQDNMQGRNAK